MANYTDNKAGSSQSVCAWLTKYNALCDDLGADITNIEGVNTTQNIRVTNLENGNVAQQAEIDALETSVTELQDEAIAQQTQIDGLVALVGTGEFVPLAGATVPDNFFLKVVHPITGDDIILEINQVGVFMSYNGQGGGPVAGVNNLGFAPFNTASKAGYLNDTTLRRFSQLGAKEWVASEHLIKVVATTDASTEVLLPYARHLFFNVENFDSVTQTTMALDGGGLYVDGDRITLNVPNMDGIVLRILSQSGLIKSDIAGATTSGSPGAAELVVPAQPTGTYCSKYEMVYSSMFGFLVDVKHYI